MTSLTIIVGLLTLGVAECGALWWKRAVLARRGFDFAIAGRLLAAMLGAGVLLWAAFFLFHLQVERHAVVLWAAVCGTAIAAGVYGAARLRRVPWPELFLAALFVLEIAAAVTLSQSAGEKLSSAPLRTLLVSPAAVALCGYFGASLGFVLFGEGRLVAGAGYETRIGGRFLLSKSSPVLSTVTIISIIGVSLGVALVIFALGILSGFEGDLQRKIIGAGAHLVVERRDSRPFALTPEWLSRIDQTPGIVATNPFLEGEVAVASQSNYTGAVLFGVDPHAASGVLKVLIQLQEGSLASLYEEMKPTPTDGNDAAEFAAPANIPGIVMGVEMAKTLNVRVGERVRVLSPLLEVMTPVGMAPRSMGFRVAGIFSSKMYEFDAKYVYASLPAMRHFLDVSDDVVTGVQARATDADSSSAVAHALGTMLAPDGFEARDWSERNQTLFSALKLERVVALVVLAFIILVASFSIVNTLAMSVIEKRKEIAILKTMGASDVGIMKVFLTQGLMVGGTGSVLGTILGTAVLVALKRFGFWIPGEVYYIDSLPVELNAMDVVLVLLAALLIVWDFSVLPALSGSRLKPVEGLRDG